MKRLFFFLFAACAALLSASAQTPGYAIFGPVPYGYTDLTDQVEVSTSISSSADNLPASDYVSNISYIDFIGKGLGGGNLCQTNTDVSIRFKTNQTLTLTDKQAVHISIRRTDDKTSGNVAVSMILQRWGGSNARGRIAYQISASQITAEESEIVLDFSERVGAWSTDVNLVNNFVGSAVSFTGADNDSQTELFRISAANGESFEITQIYIKADETALDPVPPVAGDETDPADLTLAASNIQDKSVTLTASATDDNSPISYEFFYKADGASDFISAGTVSATSGADAVKVISGLTPSTTYSFKVVATDPSNNSSEESISDVTTASLIERRYYFFRGDPASVSLPSDGVISYDLRKGKGTTIGNGGGFAQTQKKYYTNFVNNSTGWWSFNQSLSAATDMSEITQAEWYLVVKFRTTITDNRFNIRLNEGISYQVNQSNLPISTDGTWNELTLVLADAKNTLSYSAFSSGKVVFQFHADGGEGYLDIAYAYLTNNAASVDDLADNVAPAISSIVEGDKTTNSVVLTVTASDDSGEDITYIVKEGTTVLTSTPATGASGASTAITVSDLSGANHTLTVIARDEAGNEASQDKAITLPAAVSAPTNLAVSTTNTDKSVTFTMFANDDNASLVYAILDGSDNVRADNIAGTAGENTVYTLKGLTPETDYSFKVRATNAASLSTTSEVINITTNALSEHRFYLTRGDNTGALPSAANLSSTYVDCKVEFGNSSRDNRASDYISAKTGATWIAITLKPKATVENEIDDDWYVVVRFRSNLSNNVFGFNNFRLNLSNGAENWYVDNSDDDKPFGHDYNDGQWVVLKKCLGSRRAGSAVPASYLTGDQVAVQLHVNANLIAGEFLDIDYAYFTDDITSVDEGTQFNKRIVLSDQTDNSSVLSANNGATVDVDLTRSIVSTSYNTLCLPFGMNAAQIEEYFGADANVARLAGAAIEGDELILGFAFVDAIQAGVPYIIQPKSNVTNPLIANVTIANTETPAVFSDVRFVGVFNPTEIEQQSKEEHTVLLLGADNQLSWPNATANLKGTRAYFRTNSTVARVARRARFSFEGEQVATGLGDVQGDKTQSTKLLRDGQLYILHNGVMYNVQGVRVQ